jgi:succinate dehydrogenase / fumarate reductase cytochrome b subunit
MAPRARPISPHLEVYRFTLTMAMSIVHRITGVANYVGTLLLIAWLGAAALGDEAFALVNGFFGSWIGQVILFGYTWSLFHHMFGGLKHFVWDSGRMLDPAGREIIVRIQVVASVLLTLAVWALYVWGRG